MADLLLAKPPHIALTSSKMRLALVGYRRFQDYELFSEIVHRYIAARDVIPQLILSGGCEGTDKLAERWASENKIPIKVLLPDSKKEKSNKRFLDRDREIARQCTDMIAFPSTRGRGTQHTIRFAQEEKRRVEIHWVCS